MLRNMELEFMNEKATDNATNKTRLSKLLIFKWLSKASANGLNHLADQGKLTKLFWFIIILSAYTCLSIHVTMLTVYYLSYPTAYEYRLESVLVEMPDITICREGTVESDINKKNGSLLNKKLWNKLFSYERNIDKLRYAPYMFLRGSTFSKTFAEKNSYLLKSYQIFCNFLGSPCNENDFFLFIDTMFYKCFTYRPKKADISMNGKILDIGFNSLKNMIADSPNIIVTVHERGTIPLIFKNGVTLLPGRHTNIQIESLKISLANLPNHPCHENATISLNDVGNINDPFKYTKEMCVFNEIQDQIKSECGCWSPVIRVDSSNNSISENCFVKAFDAENDVLVASKSQESIVDSLRSPEMVNLSEPFINSTDHITTEEIEQCISNWTPETNFLFTTSSKATRNVNNFIEKARIQLECHQKHLQLTSEYFLKSKCLKACQWNKLRTYVTSEEITMDKLLAIKEYVIEPILNKETKIPPGVHMGIVESAPMVNVFKSEDTIAASNTKSVISWLSQVGNDGKKNNRRRRQSPSNDKELEKVTLLSLFIVATPGDEIIEVQLYRISALLSEIGGVLGLWCGASVISLCELVQLIWLLFNVTVLNVFSMKQRPTQI